MAPNPVDRWSWEKALGITAAVVSIITVMSGALWMYAGVSYASQAIPQMQVDINAHGNRLSTLEEANKNRDLQYSEILSQLNRLNDKFDRFKEDRK